MVFINNLDIVGGAAIATRRLIQGLKERYDIEYLYIVDVSKTTSYALPKNMQYARDSMFKKAIENVINTYSSRLGYLYTFLPFSKKNIEKIVHDFKPDIIVLNNIHGGYFQTSLIETLSKKTPLVWILHDMWAITGKCEYSYDCDRWMDGCGECPYLDEYPRVHKDKTKQLWEWKKQIYQNSNLAIVTPSRWLYESVGKSPLLSQKKRYNIPCVIDLDIFKPKEKAAAKKVLGIAKGSITLMFAPYDVNIKRKGFDLLLEVLRSIDGKIDKKVTLLLVGNSLGKDVEFRSFTVKEVGFVQNEEMLSICYNASDIFLLPSRNDNYPLVLMEAVSCGVPCITFDVGGCGEIVKNGENGFAITPFDTQEFERKLLQMIDSPDMMEEFHRNCLGFVQRNYADSLKKYYDLFKKVMHG